MHRHFTRTPYRQGPGSVGRGLVIAAALCVLLAGCAGTGPRPGSDTGALDSEDLAQAASSADPIGTLVTRKLTRERQQAIADPLISEALDQLGVRYRYGGSSPDTGFDCSGLVAYTAERALGLKLPRNSSAMALMGTAIEKKQLQPGDLVFFNTLGRRYSHVGIYLGENRFVHSPSSGGVVRIEKMTLAYWSKRYNGARRLDGGLLASARGDTARQQ
ncbi:C40 family peptidase [Bordetella sp. BOR01]|uniref:C40 family peptidase n=1 Tax=Bordetella sp. BOR01 TaxID=2854779 RepID=UPI001C4814BD|nr:C40 family peptidase [Bordetella sp. BOR01]MBV7481985.1 C40 family peptidase [Bordetella sp. BOR01]